MGVLGQARPREPLRRAAPCPLRRPAPPHREQGFLRHHHQRGKSVRKIGLPHHAHLEVQGNYGFIQCAKGCHDALYPDERLMRAMAARTEDLRIPRELVPACPVCGGPMDIHVRKDAFFVEDGTWREASERYGAFVRSCASARTVLLELGVGFNTPGIIRYPFENMALNDPENVTLVRLNRDQPRGWAENGECTATFAEEMSQVIADLTREGDRP